MKKTLLRRVSRKRAAQLREYRKLKAELFKDDPYCEFPDKDFPMCPERATDPHHAHGRIGERLLDRKNIWLLCRAHHRWVEDNKREARKIGLITY